MNFESALFKATLLRRYKRFLADVRREDQATLTVHCPNTGAMTGCDVPGSEVWCSISDKSARKYACTLEVVCAGEDRVVVNTRMANAVVSEALRSARIAAFANYGEIQAVVRTPGGESRLDFLLSGKALPNCYLEVKSMTLLGEQGRGYFPDTRSERATKHVHTLVELVAAGHRAAMVFCVMHSGIRTASVAGQIDPSYAAVLKAAQNSGVEVYAYSTHISEQSVQLQGRIPFEAD